MKAYLITAMLRKNDLKTTIFKTYAWSKPGEDRTECLGSTITEPAQNWVYRLML